MDKDLILKSLIIFLLIFGMYCLIKYFNQDLLIVENYTKHFEALITFIFFISIGFIVYKSKILKNNEIYRLIFYVATMICILAPLVMVSPLGPRCYVMVYILMIIFTVDLSQILYNNKYINFKRLPKLLVFIALCQIVSYLIIYGSIYLTNEDRVNLIR